MKRVLGTAGAVAALLIGVACGGDAPGARAPDAEPGRRAPVDAGPAQTRVEKPLAHGDIVTLSDGTRTPYWGEADVRGKTSARVVIGDAGSGRFYFSPTILTGSPGQTLTLRVVNETSSAHPFRIGAKDVDVAPSATTSVQVTFPSSGALTFECPHGHAGELGV